MKKLSIVLLAIVLISALILSGCAKPAPAPAPKPAPAPAPVTLRFGTFDAKTGFVSAAHEKWAEELEKRTQGRYKVEIGWGGAMGAATELYDRLTSGVIDIGYFLPPNYPGLFPLSDIPYLPWVFSTSRVGVESFWQFYKMGYLDKEYANMKTLFVWAGPGAALFSTKPITTLTDLKGMKIISRAEAGSRIVKLMGGVPVSTSMGESYGALKTRIADGYWFNWVGVVPFKLQEVVSYCAEPIFATASCAVGMNKESYNKLPKDVQAIIDQMSEEILLPLTIKGYDDVIAAGRKVFAEAGGKTTQWSSADLAEMDKLFVPLWEDWITDMEAKGLPARKAVDAFWSQMKSLGAEKPAVGYTPRK